MVTSEILRERGRALQKALAAKPAEEQHEIRARAGKAAAAANHDKHKKRVEMMVAAMASGYFTEKELKEFPECAPDAQIDSGRWTFGESFTVAKKTADLILQAGLHDLPGNSDKTGWAMATDCLREAQMQVLPRERRKMDFKNRRAFRPWFWALVNEGCKFFKAQNEKDKLLAGEKSQPLLNGNNWHSHSNGHGAAPAARVVAAPEPGLAAPQSPLEAAIDHRIRYFLDPLESVLMEEIERLGEQVKTLQEQMAKGAGPQAYVPPEKPKPTSVAIIGCWRSMFDQVVAKAREGELNLELRWYDFAAHPIPIKAEWAITCKGAHGGWLKKLEESGIPRDHQMRIDGGASRVFAQLEAWFARE